MAIIDPQLARKFWIAFYWLVLVIFSLAFLVDAAKIISEDVHNRGFQWMSFFWLAGAACSFWVILGWIRRKIPERKK